MPNLFKPASAGSVDSDSVTADFNIGGETLSIDDFTTYHIESDFMVPADHFTFTIEDDRASQLTNKIQIGSPLTVKINGAPQLVGYVDHISFKYDRHGAVLTISGRDALGLMSDSTCNPGLQYDASTSIKKILTDLFTIFNLTPTINDAADLTVATAGLQGLAVHNKQPKAIAKSWARKLGRQVRPKKEEGYLEYAIRLSKELGLYIKLTPGSSNVNVNTPTYDRTTAVAFQLTNRFAQFGNTARNNVLAGDLAVDWTKQPSCVVAEMEGGNSNPIYRRDVTKVLALNELTAFDSFDFDPNDQDEVLAAVNSNTYDILQQFQGFGYMLVPINIGLLNSIPSLLKIQPDVGQLSRPMFTFDRDASTAEELEFFTLEKLASHQNHFMKLDYTVKDHTFTGQDGFKLIWTPNTMVYVRDDRFNLDGNYWLQKRVFSKSRHEGTLTKLELRLPYIYNFYVTQ